MYWDNFIKKTLERMREYKTKAGVISAEVVRYTELNVIIAVENVEKETRYKTVTKGNFETLENWIESNYELV